MTMYYWKIVDGLDFELDFQLIPSVIKALKKLPEDVIAWTAKNIVLVSSRDNVNWFQNLEDYRDKKGFVVLCSNWKESDEATQAYIIAHEIAHAKLGHRKTSQDDIYDNHEKEADELAKKWLNLKE